MKDTTAVIKRLRQKGYTVEQGKNGHWNISMKGKYITNLSFSPAREPNTKWLMRWLKRAGIDL